MPLLEDGMKPDKIVEVAAIETLANEAGARLDEYHAAVQSGSIEPDPQHALMRAYIQAESAAKAAFASATEHPEIQAICMKQVALDDQLLATLDELIARAKQLTDREGSDHA